MKILVVAPAWIGDLIIAQGLFKLIAYQNPQVEIHVLALDHLHDLLALMPEVTKVIAVPFRHGEFKFWARWQFGKKLRNQGYTQALVLPNSWKSAIIPWAAKIPKRTGFCGELRYGLLNDVRKTEQKLALARYLTLGLQQAVMPELSLLWPRLVVSNVTQVLQKFGLAPTKPILVLCPGGAYGPAKRWPASAFASLAQAKRAEGFDVWVLGGREEQALAKSMPEVIDFTGKTSLAEAAALLSLALVVVTNDTGLMHLAAALDVPLVAIFGGTPWQETPPLSKKAKILALPLACSPCRKRECPFGHYNCLTGISVTMVAKAISEIT